MRLDAAAFAEINLSPIRKPRITVEIAFDKGTWIDTWYLTSHADCAIPSGKGAYTTYSCVKNLSVKSQELKPDVGATTVGNMSIDITDSAADITDLFHTQLVTNSQGAKGSKVTVYLGYSGLAWSDYVVIATQFIDGTIPLQESVYRIETQETLWDARAQIFTPEKTVLTATITATQTTIPVESCASFTAVVHDAGYSDAPSLTVGYGRIKETGEIFRWQTKNGGNTQFETVTRGVLGTQAQAIEYDANKEVTIEEVIYLEGPAGKLAYAALTGSLYGDSATLPDHWHAGIDTAQVNVNSFLSVGDDFWKSSDPTVGDRLQFISPPRMEARQFIEQQCLYGFYLHQSNDGKLNLRKVAAIGTNSGYVALLDHSKIVSHGPLEHKLDEIRNVIDIEWDYDYTDPQNPAYARQNTYIDAQSITVHKTVSAYSLAMLGVRSGQQAWTALTRRFDYILDRYSSPPLRLQVQCLPSCNVLEVGDTVRVQLSTLRNWNSNTTLDQVFEIQSKQWDMVSGLVTFDLFGTAQLRKPISWTSATAVIADTWYTGSGTNLATEFTGKMTGNTLTSDHTITGDDTSVDNAIFYYDGDLTIGAGVTLTLTKNVFLRIKGKLTEAATGKITTKGQGKAGATAPSPPSDQWDYSAGTQALFGITQSDGGLYISGTYSGGDFTGTSLNTTQGTYTTGTRFPNQFPGETDIKWDGTNLTGYPTQLQGTGGPSGLPARINVTGLQSDIAAGGNGGAGGGGALIVCRGYQNDGTLDTSGNDGSTGSSVTVNLAAPHNNQFYAGSGGGGSPGTAIIVLDGSNVYQQIPDATKFIAKQGLSPTPASATRVKAQLINKAALVNISSPARGYLQSTWHNDASNQFASYHRIQYVQDNVPVVSSPDFLTAATPTITSVQSDDAQMIINRAGTNIGILVQWSNTDKYMTGWEVQFKKSADSTYSALPPIHDKDITWLHFFPVLVGETYDIRVRGFKDQVKKVYSDWATYTGHTVDGKNTPPSAVDSFLYSEQLDGTRQFDIVHTVVPFDFKGYKLYYGFGSGLTLGNMTPMHEGLLRSFPYETNQFAAGAYTFAVTVWDIHGLESQPKYIQATIGSPRAETTFLTQAEHPTWSGTKTSCFVNEQGWLEANGTATWDGVDPLTWDQAGTWDNADGSSPPSSPITYEMTSPIDLGSVRRSTIYALASGTGTIAIQVNYSDDNSTYSGWVDYTGQTLTTRYFKFKVTVTGSSPILKTFVASFAGAIRRYTLEDVDLSTYTGSYHPSTGVFKLNFTNADVTINGVVSVTPIMQNADSATWSWKIINKTVSGTVGPQIEFRNSGTLTDPTSSEKVDFIMEIY